MNSAIGNSGLLYIVIFIIGVVMVFVVGAVSYSKAYRVKNRIIQVIEDNEMFDQSLANNQLGIIGYRTVSSNECSNLNVNGEEYENLNTSTYKYCVYQICLKEKKDSGGCNGEYYYKVITYTHINLPVVGTLIESPVYGETKILGKKYNY